MARYIRDISLNQPEDFVSFMMNDYLQKNSFSMSDWKGEAAYRAGDAMMEGYKYLKWSYVNGVFHLEAWLRGTFGGEWDLNGFVGCAMKQPYKKELENLIALLQQNVTASVGTQTIQFPDGTVETKNIVPVTTTDNSGAATQALVFGILAIVFCCIPIFSILFAVLALSRARVGKYSSKGDMAKAGKICAIIGCCMEAALWLLAIITNVMEIALGSVIL